MSTLKYLSMARKHWTTWLPAKVAALKNEGELEQALWTAAHAAQERLLELMMQGWQEHEADEVARHEFIQLKPEPGANKAPWERKEEARLDAEFMAMQAAMRKIDAKHDAEE